MKKLIAVLVCLCVSISFASTLKVSRAKPRVEIQWFFDFLPVEAHQMPPVLDEIARTNTGVNIVYRPVSLLGYSSLVEAKAALAAAKQGRSVRFRRYLLSHTFLAKTRVHHFLGDKKQS